MAKRSWIGASIEDFIRFGSAHVPAMLGGKKAAELKIRQLLNFFNGNYCGALRQLIPIVVQHQIKQVYRLSFIISVFVLH